MKTLKQQAAQILESNPGQDAVFYLRRYFGETYLRINNVSGTQVSLEVIREIASSQEYDEASSLDWLWQKEDDEFLLATHVESVIKSELDHYGIEGLKFSVTQQGQRNGVRLWGIEIKKEDLEGQFTVFDVRGVKNLVKEVNEAYYVSDK